MEEHISSKGGQDWRNVISQKVELQECQNELGANQKLLEQANNAINDLKKRLQEEISLKDNALNELSNFEIKYERTADENARLKKQVDRTRDDGRRNREKLVVEFENTENRLNDSLQENDDLHQQLEDLQNNNLSLEEDCSNRDSEISQLRDEQDEILEEMERLREENDRLNHLGSQRKLTPRVYEVGIQCESRMCEKACQTRNPHYTPRSSRLPRPISQLNGSSSNIRRACSVGNLSSRAESPVRGHPIPHGGSTRDIASSSRIPIGRHHHDSQSAMPNRYQSLVQGQNKELASLRRQLDQSRCTTARLRSVIEDFSRNEGFGENRRQIQLARRIIRKLEGELEDRGESATSECPSDSEADYDREESTHIQSRILPAVMEIKQMVNGLREQIQVNSASNVTSPRSAFSGPMTAPSPTNNNNYSSLSSPLDMNRLNQRVQESKKISRSLQDAFDGLDSGTGVSPIDFSNLNGLHEHQLIPGLVQDLQSLRFKLDTSVKKQEKLSNRLEGRIRERKVSASEMSTQTDLSGTTIALYNDELGALRSALNDKDVEIDRLRAENIERLAMPPPNHSSTPSSLASLTLNLKSSKRKSKGLVNGGPLTPPTSSGAEDNPFTFNSSSTDLRTLRESLNQARLHTKTIFQKLEYGLETKNDAQSLQDVHTIVNSLDDMAKVLQKLQYKSTHSDVHSDSGEVTRLRTKVTKLEKLLAQSCARLRNNNLLKQGLDHQITTKLNQTAGVLSRARINLGSSTPSTSRATSLNGDSY